MSITQEKSSPGGLLLDNLLARRNWKKIPHDDYIFYYSIATGNESWLNWFTEEEFKIPTENNLLVYVSNKSHAILHEYSGVDPASLFDSSSSVTVTTSDPKDLVSLAVPYKVSNLE